MFQSLKAAGQYSSRVFQISYGRIGRYLLFQDVENVEPQTSLQQRESAPLGVP